MLTQQVANQIMKMVLTFIFRERHLPLFKVPTHLPVVTHLQNQVHVVAVLEIVIQLKERCKKYLVMFVGNVTTCTYTH